MLNALDKLSTLNKIKIIENNLIELKEYDLCTDILEELILFCQTFDKLSLDEIQQSEKTIANLYILIKNNKKLPVGFKREFLKLIKQLENNCTSLMVNTIIDLI